MNRHLRSCSLVKPRALSLWAILATGLLAPPCFAYTNPVRNVDGPDPGVMYDAGTFWMVHTGGNAPAWPLRSSSSLVSGWGSATNKITTANQPAWLKGPYWAPEIHRVQSQKATIPLFQTESFTYHIFSTGQRTTGGWCVLTATSSTPGGSYTVSGTGPLVHPDVIDPHLFQDYDGKKYLLWHLDPPNCIQGRELNATCTGFAPGSSTVTLISPTESWEAYNPSDPDSGNVEGGWMIKRGAYYYLIYSGHHFGAKWYATGVARSTSPLGPFTKFSGNPILKRNSDDTFTGPGHGCIIRDCQGADWYFYHAYVGNPPGSRVQMLDKVIYNPQGWPTFGNGGTPSTTAQTNPVFTGDNAPTCSVAFPAPGTTVSGTTVLSAAAADESDVTEVVFYRWGPFATQIRIGNATPSYYGWIVNWDTTTVANGNHDVFAVATDTYGHLTYSTGLTVNVQN